MTARTPRDNRLRLVPRQSVTAARRAVADRALKPAPRPPEGIASPAELATQARARLAGAVRLARWAERVGDPSKASAEEAAAELGTTPEAVRADWDRARLAGLVELHEERARAGWRLRAWNRDDGAVLRGWLALFDAWSFAHNAPEDHSTEAIGEAIEAMPQLLALLHLSDGPVRIPALLDLLQQRVAELRTEHCEVPYDESGPVPGGGNPSAATAAGRGEELPVLLDWALEALASVGAATLDTERREAALTPLGHWAVWAKIEQICVAAQSPVGNIEQPAEAMLRGCADLSPRPARAEYRAWLAARPTGSAVTQLLEAARGEDALLRGLAFEALRVVGGPAEQAVREILEERTLRPYALLWLAVQEGADPEDAASVLSREEATWLWVDTAAAVSDHGEGGLLVRHLESAVQGTVPELLAEVRAVGHPRTVQVLVALAAVHPDPALAKAVRRAAFQVHTGGA